MHIYIYTLYIYICIYIYINIYIYIYIYMYVYIHVYMHLYSHFLMLSAQVFYEFELPIYRLCIAMTFGSYLWAGTCYLWSRARVNYLFLFELRDTEVRPASFVSIHLSIYLYLSISIYRCLSIYLYIYVYMYIY